MFLRTDEVVDYLTTILTPQASGWGINGVYEWDNNLTPNSPALVLIGQPRLREYVGAHNFKITFRVTMFVVNGNMNISKSARQSATEVMSDNIVAYLDANMNLGGNIVQGWVERDVGGTLELKRGNVWVGHRIDWVGEVRQVV